LYCIVAAEVEVYKAVLKRIFIYGCQTWSVAEKQKIVLNPLEMKILRKLYGPVIEKTFWRIRSNQEHEIIHLIEDF
jgi:hypothetical protein